MAPHHRAMKPVPAENMPGGLGAKKAWISRDFLAVLYEDQDTGADRLTVNSTTVDRDTGRWRDGITWDELMEVKRQCGLDKEWAVEVYPPDTETVNVAAMRHLWLLPHPPTYAWRKAA
ncbi:MAG TPA: hypothetical protein DCL06_06245 [Corynebacterium variabile]|uniref:DUF7694 domain-containing protein n=1 Tax=Corynebacterium variabile TaxID=1727 RepID=A0A3B9QU73_9CORY|nr:hypothetical protein [Corynebacterium variabile]